MNIDSQLIQGVFFDLDGTLVDTAPDFIELVNELRVEYAFKPLPEKNIRHHVSQGAKALVLLALEISDDDSNLPLLRTQFMEKYQKKIANPHRDNPADLYKLFLPLIQVFQERSLPWGVVTNKPVEPAQTLLKQLKILDICHTLICPEHVNRTKPHPESLLLACKETGCSPEAVLYVGDHQRDIQAGYYAGMKTMVAKYGYIHELENTLSWGADYEIAESALLLPWLENKKWRL